MKQRLLFGFLVLLTGVGVAIGCGDDDTANGNSDDPQNQNQNDGHPYQTQCESECSYDGEEDCEEHADDCLDTCLSRTESLEGSCGNCVAEHFDVGAECMANAGGNGPVCSCFADEGSVTDCEEFCE